MALRNRSLCRGTPLNAEATEIAFTKKTSEAISFVANGLDWQPDDEVVSVESEFPADYYPWEVQEKKGVRLVLVKEKEGRVDLDSVVRVLTPRTRVVGISFVQFLSGYRVDLDKLGEICASRRILFFVDAIRGLGAFPVDVRRGKISALAADGQKWLFGPEGSGLFFLRRELLDEVRPSTVGWMILVAPRCGRVRVAPHFYNTEQEIDRVLELLGSFCQPKMSQSAGR